VDLDPECRAALDLAKISLPAGEALNVELVLKALYFGTDLHRRCPSLSQFLTEPVRCREEPPGKVPVAEPLKPILTELVAADSPVSAGQFFSALLRSDEGRGYLASCGVKESEIASVLQSLSLSEERAGWRESPARKKAVEALSSYGRMLTDKGVTHGGLVEKETSLRALVRTLCKRKRRNALVIGQPGTGKSALVLELAHRLVNGHAAVPPHLRDYDIFEMSPTFLKAGASVVGQFEERMKALIKVLEANPKIILFVDEIHTLFQSGLHSKGPFSDAGDILKGALARGGMTCIGCTTSAEYRHYLEPDGALIRRFSLVTLDPPSARTTKRILRSRLPRVADFYSPLHIPETVVDRAVDLTEEYLPNRFQPDKSIQLLDEACAYCMTADPPAAELTEEVLWQALEDTIGHSVIRTETLTEQSVLEDLQAKIIGQDAVLKRIARAFVAGLGDWQEDSGPRGVFLFGGPTGVGKTETALTLAAILGGGEESLVRVDCNTLQGSGYDGGPAVNRLLGVPPGYIGYARGQGGILSKVRDFPESVILFDEFEKSPPSVGELLLQILDTARVEDVDGQVLDFRRSFIVFTTNAGCVYEKPKAVGYGTPRAEELAIPEASEDRLTGELRSLGIGQEFLGRIDHILVFRGLDRDSIRPVVERQMDKLERMAAERSLGLAWDPRLVEHLASQWQPRFGVRHLSTILMHRVTEQLNIAEAQGEMRGVKKVRLELMESGRTPAALDLAGLAAHERRGEEVVVRLA